MSHPELEYASEEPTRTRRGSWVFAIGAFVIVIALIVSLGGLWRVFMPNGGPNGEMNLELELPEIPSPNAFGAQSPKWTDCGDGFECADVYAPMSWDDTAGDTITLRLVKYPAQGGDPIGTLFVNPGGPGASGASFIRNSVEYAVGDALRQNFDVIGWDPRGVGASTPVRCLDASEMDEYLFGSGDDSEKLERGSAEWIEAAIESSREFGEACADTSGPMLAHVDTMSTVHDLDMLREIVGDAQLNYLGYSYGTYIGARYADEFPENVGRMVLDGALDPATTQADVVRSQTRGFEQALRAYVASCLNTSDCPLSGSVDEAMAQIGDLLDAVKDEPLTGSDGRTFNVSTFITAIVTPLYSQQSWGYLSQLFSSVAEGNADIGLALADSYYGRENGQYSDNSTEAFQAINCLDYPNDIDLDRMRDEAEELERIAPTIGRFQGYGDVGCAGWPYPGVSERGGVTGAGAEPILVVGTTGDPATPYDWAVSLSEQLESGMLLTFEGEGHTAYGKNSCIDELVENYLISGEYTGEITTCR